jgi:NAD-dependent SIR2 family protein deacetylase
VGEQMLIDDKYAEHLARLLIDRKLVLFAGAGLSLQAKHKADENKRLPLWWNLAELVSDNCKVPLSHFRNDIFDLFDAISRDQSRHVLEDAVRKFLPDYEYEPGPTHYLISKLPWNRVYTTNYDDLLKRTFEERYPITNEQEFEYLNRSPDTKPRLIHLHGTLQNMHTLTGEDYQNWENNHPNAIARFVADGAESSILFIGYSNSDPHFKFRILPLVKRLKSSRGQRNYSWMWSPTEAQVKLFGQRDGIDVHPVEADDEWAKNMGILFDAYDSLIKSGGKVPVRKRQSKLFGTKSEAEKPVYINGYKLFYHRDFRNIARETLAKRSKIDVKRLKILETVKLNKPLGESCFKKSSVFEIWNLEKSLRPKTSLEYGKDEDDFLAFYIEYYKNNWKKSREKAVPQQNSVFRKTKAVVFDFGGTLTVPQFRENTWERIWRSVGYSLEEANALHHRFSTGKITHKEWCDMTCEKLRARNFSRVMFEQIFQDVKSVDGLLETFQ